jgi:RNA recognition motif-containing protein
MQVCINMYYIDWLLQEQPEKTVDGGACSTLFIANLGPNCTEDELKQVLSQ